MKRYLIIALVFIGSGCDPVAVSEVSPSIQIDSIATSEADTVEMTTGLGVEPLN